MIRNPENSGPQAEHESWLETLALRDGEPSEWERPEYGFEVSHRVTKSLDLKHHTPEIRSVSIAESDRQQALFDAWERHVQESEEYVYRKQMGSVAMKLVEMLVPPDDPRDRSALVDDVLNTLYSSEEAIS